MKICSLMIILLLVGGTATRVFAHPRPDAVVIKLYGQIVARHPLGIPKSSDKNAIRPFLSKRLIQEFKVAQECEDDYVRKHADDDGKPEFDWMERGLFSGSNEKASPFAAVVERTEPKKDGYIQVYVKLTYKDTYKTYGRPIKHPSVFHWHVAAIVIREAGRFVVDDVVQYNEGSTEIKYSISSAFIGCDGSHWVGEKVTDR